MDRRVWQMAIARAINTMGLSLVMSFLGIYVVHGRGYSAATYGVIALAANLGQSLSSAWAGALSDRIGRRPLITTTLFVRAGFIALLGTQVAFDAPLWSLGANIVITSTLRGCFEPVAYALVADVVREDQRVAAFGIQRMGTNLGWAIGPALGGLLTLVMPYGTVFYIAAAGMIGGAIITMRVAEPVRRAPPAAAARDDLLGALREGLADRVMRLLLLGTLLCALLETQMFSTFSIYLIQEIHLTKADVGALYALNGVTVLVLQMPALALIRRLGLRRVLPWSSLLDAAGFALIGLASGLSGGVLAIFVLTCAEVLFDPAHQAAIAEVADPARRGRAFGIVGFASTIGVAFAPLLGGLLFDTIGQDHVAMWLTVATIGGAQTVCFSVFVRRLAGRRAGPPGGQPAASPARNAARDPEV